jgi:hypothetical protein
VPYQRAKVKITKNIAPVCLPNLVSVKNSKYSFRYVNVLDVPRVKSTHYGKKSFNFAAQYYGIAFRTISGLKIVFHLKEYLELFTLTKFCKHTGAILFTILKVSRAIVLIRLICKEGTLALCRSSRLTIVFHILKV